ncbi:MICOS complex subunit MIC26 isoform X1 [Anolis carolinensis]|uniref:MICOS complex subunit MIC26 isoform X1 n=1 Tax=Anolis carolinensis TaxID=28377 RepID=UPI002F2B6C3B
MDLELIEGAHLHSPRVGFKPGSFQVKQLVAVPVSLSFLTVQVYAASPEKEASKKSLLRVDELSLYTSPAPKSKYVEDPQTQLEEGISRVRHSLEPYTGWFQDFSGKAKPKLEKVAEYGREGCELLQNPPPGFYPRLGVIGFAGVIGLFLARGSKVKRFVYPVSFIGICASLYYPQQAITIGKVTSSRLYDWSLQAYINIESLWKDTPKKKKSAKASDKYRRLESLQKINSFLEYCSIYHGCESSLPMSWLRKRGAHSLSEKHPA